MAVDGSALGEMAADLSFHFLSSCSDRERDSPAQGLQLNPGGGGGVVAKMVPWKGMLGSFGVEQHCCGSETTGSADLCEVGGGTSVGGGGGGDGGGGPTVGGESMITGSVGSILQLGWCRCWSLLHSALLVLLVVGSALSPL